MSKYGKRAEAGDIPVAEVNLRDHSRLLQTLAAIRSCRLSSQWTLQPEYRVLNLFE